MAALVMEVIGGGGAVGGALPPTDGGAGGAGSPFSGASGLPSSYGTDVDGLLVVEEEFQDQLGRMQVLMVVQVVDRCPQTWRTTELSILAEVLVGDVDLQDLRRIGICIFRYQP